MSTDRRSERFMAALAGGAIGFALACTPQAAAQQADRPAADSGAGIEDIIVAAQPNRPAPVELAISPPSTLSGPQANGGAPAADAAPPGIEGYVEGGFGSYGTKTIGGGITIPLVRGKLQLSVDGYQSHAGVR